MLHPLEELQAFSIVSHLASRPQTSEGVPKARLMNFETTNERPDVGPTMAIFVVLATRVAAS